MHQPRWLDRAHFSRLPAVRRPCLPQSGSVIVDKQRVKMESDRARLMRCRRSETDSDTRLFVWKIEMSCRKRRIRPISVNRDPTRGESSESSVTGFEFLTFLLRGERPVRNCAERRLWHQVYRRGMTVTSLKTILSGLPFSFVRALFNSRRSPLDNSSPCSSGWYAVPRG